MYMNVITGYSYPLHMTGAPLTCNHCLNKQSWHTFSYWNSYRNSYRNYTLSVFFQAAVRCSYTHHWIHLTKMPFEGGDDRNCKTNDDQVKENFNN